MFAAPARPTARQRAAIVSEPFASEALIALAATPVDQKGMPPGVAEIAWATCPDSNRP